MKQIVVDASALLPILLPDEEYQAHTDALVQLHADGKIELCAPPLLTFEILNALYLAVRGKAGRPPRLTLDRAKECWKLFQDVQITLIEPDGTRMLELANTFQLPSIYDAGYVALAEQLKTHLVTGDKRLWNTMKEQLKWIKPLWDFTA